MNIRQTIAMAISAAIDRAEEWHLNQQWQAIELECERELHARTRAELAGETKETEMLQGDLYEARSRIAELEAQLSARANWLPTSAFPVDPIAAATIVDAAASRIVELETQLAARADWRPRREMPEGWSVNLDGTLLARGDGWTYEVSRSAALALAAYLDTEVES